MHRRTNSKSNIRKEERCYSSSILVNHPCYTLALGIVATLGLSALLPSPTVSAKSYLDGSAVSIVISDDPSTAGANNYTLRPSSTGSSYAAYRKFVDIDVYGSEDYSIFIRSSSKEEATATNPNNYTWSEEYYNAGNYNISQTSNLVGKKDGNTKVIAPLSTTDITTAGTSLDNFKALPTSSWGYRWNYATLTDDKIPDREASDNTRKGNRTGLAQDLTTSDYYGIKQGGQSTELVSKRSTNTEKNASGRLLLEFGANATSDLPNDTYEGYVAVSVIATPYQATLLSPLLTDMQQMTPDICAATPTPSKDATQTATNRQAVWNTTAKKWNTAQSGLWIGTPNNTNNTVAYVSTTESNFTAITDPVNPTSNNYVPETALRDSRDGKYYLVRKLADGNCWMSNNLDFEITGNFDPTNGETDWDSSLSWNTYSGSLRMPDTAIGEAWTSFEEFRSISSLKTGTAFINRSGASYTSSDSGENIVDFTGVYYSWPAAVLGTGVLEWNYTAPSSICPRSWKLPSVSDVNVYAKLIQSYVGVDMQDFPLNYPYSGFYYSGHMQTVTTQGLWWFSSARNNTNTYLFLTRQGFAQADASGTVPSGATIRCVVRSF